MKIDMRLTYSAPSVFHGSKLTPREIQIMRLVARGANSHEIAYALGISYQTVKNHLLNAYIRLGASNRTEAVMRSIGAGYFSAKDVS